MFFPSCSDVEYFNHCLLPSRELYICLEHIWIVDNIPESFTNELTDMILFWNSASCSYVIWGQ